MNIEERHKYWVLKLIPVNEIEPQNKARVLKLIPVNKM